MQFLVVPNEAGLNPDIVRTQRHFGLPGPCDAVSSPAMPPQLKNAALMPACAPADFLIIACNRSVIAPQVVHSSATKIAVALA